MLTFGSSPNSIVCNFCGSRLNIEESKLPVNLTIGKNCFIISFKVSKEQFQNKILNWLVDGNYTPDDILYKANFQETLGIYLPFYHFSVNYRGYWNADIKHYRTETYTDWEDYYDGNRTRRRPVTKTKQVGYWVTTSGQFSGNFTGLGIASVKLPETLASFCENSALNQVEIKNIDEKYVTGFLFEHCAIPSDNILESRLMEKLNKSINEKVDDMIPVNTLIPSLGKQNVRWQIDNTAGNIITKQIYLPYWFVTYSYNGKFYQCIIDGQNSDRIEGNKPIDEEKKKKVRSFFYPLIISSALYFIAIWLMLILANLDKVSFTICGYIGLFGLIPSIVFAIIGLIKRNKLLNESKRLRQKLLKDVPEVTNIGWFDNNDSQKH
jgi:hypothetical protein